MNNPASDQWTGLKLAVFIYTEMTPASVHCPPSENIRGNELGVTVYTSDHPPLSLSNLLLDNPQSSRHV